MQEAIEDRRGEHLVAEDRAPLRHELIRRNEQAAALVPTRHELKKEVSTAALERQVSSSSMMSSFGLL
jgi:hypothetical protein